MLGPHPTVANNCSGGLSMSLSSVIQELQKLIDEIHSHVPNVPGRNRLLRGCTKELNAFQQLPPDQIEKSVSCSNLPYFKAITRLARAYSDRLVGLLCRFRMPTTDSVYQSSEHSPNQSPLRSSTHVESFIKPASVSVDLICVQKRMEDHGLRDSSSPDFWAPSLWIKAVTRDATRLNSAWRGDATQGAACLYRQTEELVSTAAWYQRGQPPGWIQVLVHWLPSKKQDICELDKDLLHSLNRILSVPILMHCHPWYPVSRPASANSPRLSLRNNVTGAARFRRKVLSNLQPSECHTVEDRTQFVKQFLRLLNSVQTDEDGPEFEEDVKDIVTRTPLDAVLRHAYILPFGRSVLDRVDTFPRVNLDVSALIALVSELSQFLPEGALNSTDDAESILGYLASPQRRTDMLAQPRFASSTFDWLLEAESAKPVLLTANDYLRDSLVLVCETAVNTFLNILITVAGPAEWLRGIHLLTRLIIVPDLVCVSTTNTPTLNPPTKMNNRQKSRLIMDVGNAFDALTVTSNSAFLRSLRSEGLKYSALLLPARALTEAAARIENGDSEPVNN